MPVLKESVVRVNVFTLNMADSSPQAGAQTVRVSAVEESAVAQQHVGALDVPVHRGCSTCASPGK